MAIYMKATCSPILKKIEGNPDIQLITPIIDAQFLIGKSWDVSLRLPWPDVFEKHCTIEKVDSGKWTVVSHENAVTYVNTEKLSYGLPKLLKFGDLLRVTSNILFRFECVCMDCAHCSGFGEASMPKIPKLISSQFSFTCSEIPGEEQRNRMCYYIPNHDNWKTSYEYLLNENVNLTTRVKKAEDVAVFWENEKDKTEGFYMNAIESYNSVVEKYSQLRRLKEESERNQSSDIKLLRDTVSNQSLTIESLKMQLNTLEGRNQQLSSENVALHAKIGEFVEYSKNLNRENGNLQAEVKDLNKKREHLEKELTQLNNNQQKSTSRNSVGNQTNIDDALVNEMRRKLSDLLETEFKCSICDEIFVEAVVTSNCAHVFCYYCIKSWKFIKPNCPICRTILTKEMKVLTIDSYLSSAMVMATDNVRSNWLKLVEERKSLKEKLNSKDKPTSSTEFRTTAWNQNTSNPNSFHDALMNVYQQLMHYDENVIDLTNDRIYGL